MASEGQDAVEDWIITALCGQNPLEFWRSLTHRWGEFPQKHKRRFFRFLFGGEWIDVGFGSRWDSALPLWNAIRQDLTSDEPSVRADDVVDWIKSWNAYADELRGSLAAHPWSMDTFNLFSASLDLAHAAVLIRREPGKQEEISASITRALESYVDFWHHSAKGLPPISLRLRVWESQPENEINTIREWSDRLLAAFCSSSPSQWASIEIPVGVGLGMVERGLRWLLGLDPMESDLDRRLTPILLVEEKKSAVPPAYLRVFRQVKGPDRHFPDPVRLGVRCFDSHWREAFDNAWIYASRISKEESNLGSCAWNIEYPHKNFQTQPSNVRYPFVFYGGSASASFGVALLALRRNKQLDKHTAISAKSRADGQLEGVGDLFAKTKPLEQGHRNFCRRILTAIKDDGVRKLAEELGITGENVKTCSTLEQAYQEMTNEIEEVISLLEGLDGRVLRRFGSFWPETADAKELHRTFCFPVRVLEEQEAQSIEADHSAQNYPYSVEEELRAGRDIHFGARPLTLESELSSSKHVVLRGEPGYGKTVALLLQALSGWKELLRVLKHPTSYGRLPPLYLFFPLSAYSDASLRDERRDTLLARAIDYTAQLSFTTGERANAINWLSRMCSNKEIDVVLCLDALDEMSTETHDLSRDLMSGSIHERVRVILTTRPSADDSNLFASQPKRLRILGLNSGGVRRYVRQYLLTPEHANDVMAVIDKSPGPRHLAQIPLLLSIICYQKQRFPNSTLPQTRTTLLGLGLRLLLEAGDRKRRALGQLDGDTRLPREGRNSLKEKCLFRVGWWYFAQGPTSIDTSSFLRHMQRYLDYLRQRKDKRGNALWPDHLAPPPDAESLLAEFVQDGILVADGQDKYRFQLRSIHEFCLASFIARIKFSGDGEFQRLAKADASEWRLPAVNDSPVRFRPIDDSEWRHVWPMIAGIRQKADIVTVVASTILDLPYETSWPYGRDLELVAQVFAESSLGSDEAKTLRSRFVNLLSQGICDPVNTEISKEARREFCLTWPVRTALAELRDRHLAMALYEKFHSLVESISKSSVRYTNNVFEAACMSGSEKAIRDLANMLSKEYGQALAIGSTSYEVSNNDSFIRCAELFGRLRGYSFELSLKFANELLDSLTNIASFNFYIEMILNSVIEFWIEVDRDAMSRLIAGVGNEEFSIDVRRCFVAGLGRLGGQGAFGVLRDVFLSRDWARYPVSMRDCCAFAIHRTSVDLAQRVGCFVEALGRQDWQWGKVFAVEETADIVPIYGAGQLERIDGTLCSEQASLSIRIPPIVRILFRYHRDAPEAWLALNMAAKHSKSMEMRTLCRRIVSTGKLPENRVPKIVPSSLGMYGTRMVLHRSALERNRNLSRKDWLRRLGLDPEGGAGTGTPSEVD